MTEYISSAKEGREVLSRLFCWAHTILHRDGMGCYKESGVEAKRHVTSN